MDHGVGCWTPAQQRISDLSQDQNWNWKKLKLKFSICPKLPTEAFEGRDSCPESRQILVVHRILTKKHLPFLSFLKLFYFTGERKRTTSYSSKGADRTLQAPSRNSPLKSDPLEGVTVSQIEPNWIAPWSSAAWIQWKKCPHLIFHFWIILSQISWMNLTYLRWCNEWKYVSGWFYPNWSLLVLVESPLARFLEYCVNWRLPGDCLPRMSPWCTTPVHYSYAIYTACTVLYVSHGLGPTDFHKELYSAEWVHRGSFHTHWCVSLSVVIFV